MAVAPVSGALSVLASGLSQARAREDADARAIVGDPFDVGAIVDLSVAALGLKAMAAAVRTVADTEGALVDMLA